MKITKTRAFRDRSFRFSVLRCSVVIKPEKWRKNLRKIIEVPRDDYCTARVEFEKCLPQRSRRGRNNNNE